MKKFDVNRTVLRLRDLGLTSAGARQAAAGMIVANPLDRARVAKLLEANLDSSGAGDATKIKVQSFSFSIDIMRPMGP